MREALEKVEEIVKETFSMWEERWQGFSWPNYYWNHTVRVRNLCLRMAGREGGDPVKLAFAATLHDITKRFDGRVLRDEEGNRVADEKGIWVMELVMPARENEVIRIYKEKNLFGTPHSLSGAEVAGEVLRMVGIDDEEFIESVKLAIEAHIRPPKADEEEIERLYGQVESRILHDADMIDANLGYTAFFRNVMIRAHYAREEGGEFDLKRYAEGLEEWVDSKEPFLERLLTEAGREIGSERQGRNRELAELLRAELEDFELNERFGLLGMVKLFAENCENPDMFELLDRLERVWMPEREREAEGDEAAGEALGRVRRFVRELREECEGVR